MADRAVIAQRLLKADEPPAFTLQRPQAGSPFLLICDHASRRIPQSLGALGLTLSDRTSHIAWDIGAAGVARRLAAKLDATLLLQNYSRLVIDCNRPPTAADAIPHSSGGIAIAGNQDLSDLDVALRRAELFEPYHAALRDVLDRRLLARRPTALIAVHSFTPNYPGKLRPWHVGLMYHRDARLASVLLGVLRSDERLCVGDNEPYQMGDDTDYSLPMHGEARGIPHVGIEIRQDLLGDAAGQESWAERFAALLPQALEALTTHR